MSPTSLSQVLVVCRTELTNWGRDRRSIFSVLIGSLFGPLIVAFMFNTMASRQRQVEDVKIPVVGAEHAPALVEWLRQQPGIEIVAGPADAQEAVRSKREDVVVVIPGDFAEKFAASKPARVRFISDSSSQSARPRLQRIRGLFQRYNGEMASLRLIQRGISPVVASPVQVEDVEVSSAQQRAAMILGFIPLFVMLSAFTGAMGITTDSTAGGRSIASPGLTKDGFTDLGYSGMSQIRLTAAPITSGLTLSSKRRGIRPFTPCFVATAVRSSSPLAGSALAA